ncbi:hypothetical protein L3476_22335 [Paenibacillus thiaminolyticus]|uniref:hypothetical protein n=1 Tax=Paenibacillus thiaminolyticus TaxID=49283 RepID=UPI002350B84F|nr:hypothetical protein [Paenibacillus thiaminolyticus]WCR26000.1 hypothetical protein L3476_22335 [Paenibacillus thiaminolyticus]
MYNNVPGHGCAACGHHPASRHSGFIGIGRRWQASEKACQLLRWKRFAGRRDTDNRFISGRGDRFSTALRSMTVPPRLREGECE